jgi:hypothetical protein
MFSSAWLVWWKNYSYFVMFFQIISQQSLAICFAQESAADADMLSINFDDCLYVTVHGDQKIISILPLASVLR